MGITHQIFSMPVHETSLPDFNTTQEDILNLLKTCLGERSQTHANGFNRSDDPRVNVTGDINLQSDPRFKSLVDVLEEISQQYWLDCDYDPNIKPKITNMWGIVNKPGGFTPPHTHSPAVITGTLYLNATPETGNFQIDHPLKELLGYMPYDFAKYPPPRKFSKSYNVAPGKVFLFPAWAVHYAKVNNSDFDRYALVFNVGDLSVAS